MVNERPTPYVLLFKERTKIESNLEEWLSEIPCLVIELPASRAISMKNPAYNGEVLSLKGKDNTVGSRPEKD